MERFSIQCTTCRARLKVNDESVIGAILACPKCGSMVQVVPPIGWCSTASASTVAAMPEATAPVSATPKPSPAVAAKPATKTQPAAKPTETVTASVRPPALPKAAAVAVPVVISLPVAIPVPDVIVEATGEVIASPGEPFRLSQLAGNLWVRLAAGASVGLLLGAVAWLALRATPDGFEAPQVAAVSATLEADPSGDIKATEPAPTATIEPSEVQAPVAASEPIAAAPSAPVAVEAEQSTQTLPTEAAAVNEPAVAPPAPSPAIRLEPIRGAATTHDTARLILETDAATNAAVVDSPLVLPAGDAPSLPAAETKSALAGRSGFDRGEIDRRLASKLPRVQFSQVPLVQVTEFLGDMTGLTITIDDAALALLGKGRKSKLSIDLSDTTAGGALKAAVKALNLRCSVRDGQIIITGDES